MDRKIIKSGNSYVLSINLTILKLLRVNPETDLVTYSVEGDKLIITKSKNKRGDK